MDEFKVRSMIRLVGLLGWLIAHAAVAQNVIVDSIPGLVMTLYNITAVPPNPAGRPQYTWSTDLQTYITQFYNESDQISILKQFQYQILFSAANAVSLTDPDRIAMVYEQIATINVTDQSIGFPYFVQRPFATEEDRQNFVDYLHGLSGTDYSAVTNVSEVFIPSQVPSSQPSAEPSAIPSSLPSSQPSGHPTLSIAPSVSSQPSDESSAKPSDLPSSVPSDHPTSSSAPSSEPSSQPSAEPSAIPSILPSSQPSGHPTMSIAPSRSSDPSRQPSAETSAIPSSLPSSQPSGHPTMSIAPSRSSDPSSKPSDKFSAVPSSLPSSQPSGHPTMSFAPSTSNQPSSPTKGPTSAPSKSPSATPTLYSVEVTNAEFDAEQTYFGIDEFLGDGSGDGTPWTFDMETYIEQFFNDNTSSPVFNVSVHIEYIGTLRVESSSDTQNTRSLQVQDAVVYQYKQTSNFSTYDPGAFNGAFIVEAPFASDDDIVSFLGFLEDAKFDYSSIANVSEAVILSQAPSQVPSEHPSQSPSLRPSELPSLSSHPSYTPSISSSPSDVPTATVSAQPSNGPSESPSLVPTAFRSDAPSKSAEPSVSARPSVVTTTVNSVENGIIIELFGLVDLPGLGARGEFGDLTALYIEEFFNNATGLGVSDVSVFIPSFRTVGDPASQDIPNLFSISKKQVSKSSHRVNGNLFSLGGGGRRALQDVPSVLIEYDQVSNFTAIYPEVTRSYIIETPFKTEAARQNYVAFMKSRSPEDEDYSSLIAVSTVTIPSTDGPSQQPSQRPSKSLVPSLEPSGGPSLSPSEVPSLMPSGKPSDRPSFDPSTSRVPSLSPSIADVSALGSS